MFDYTVNTVPLCTRDTAAADLIPLLGENRKNRHYIKQIPENIRGNVRIVPLAFSVFGRPSSLGLETIKSVARFLSGGVDLSYGVIYRRICETVSVQLFKGNSGILGAYADAMDPAPIREGNPRPAA